MTETALESPSKTAEWKSLLGFLPQDDATNLVLSQGIPLEPSAKDKLTARINEAIDHCASIVGRRSLTPVVKEILSTEFLDRSTRLTEEPTFKEHLGGMKDWSFGLVEIGKLHAFQPNLNLDYVNRLKERAPIPKDISGLLKFCLPTREEISKSPAAATFNPNTNTFTLASENLDVRILGNVQGEDPQTGRRFFGIAYGGGLPQISVVEYKGLYMIKNGYHRAYSLLEKGHDFMPCLIVRTDNYQLTGASGPGFFGFDLMLSDRSPIMNDFLSSAAVTYPRRLMRLIVSVHGEVQVIPV